MEQLVLRLKRILLRLIEISIFGSALTFFPPVFFIQEVNANLGLYYFAAHLASGALIFFWRKNLTRRARIFYSLALTVMIARYALIIYPFYFSGSPQEQGDQAGFSLLYANVYRPNARYSELQAQIAKYDPDIVALTEFDQRWQAALGLDQKYPYFVEESGAGHFSVALYSKFPFSKEPRVSLGVPLPPIIALELVIKEHVQKVYLLLLHARPPVSDEWLNESYLIFRRSATLLREMLARSPDLVVVGDLNATPFSRYYRKFVAWLELKNAMHGYGLRKTWRSFAWYYVFTIDHVLYRGGLSVLEFKVLPGIGSDHYPLFVRFAGPPEAQNTAAQDRQGR